MKEGCIACKQGLEVLEQKLRSGEYNQLEDLALCDTCRTKLLKSLEEKGDQDAS